MNLGLEALGIKKSVDYTAKCNLVVLGKQVESSIRIVTESGIISPETFKTYYRVITSIDKYVNQVIEVNTGKDGSKIDFVSIEISRKAPKGEHFVVGVGFKGDEHIYDAEFLNDKLIYTSAQG